MVDVIMLSKGDRGQLKNMTQRAINSIHASGVMNFNIICVETITGVSYKGSTMVHPNEPFNYNKFTKYGLEKCSGEYVLFVNNDILAHKDFAPPLINYLFTYQWFPFSS